MAPPLERWYLGAIRNEEDLHRSLRNLERILERKDEIFQGSSVPGAPDDATYIVESADPSIPNARELVDGFNTTVDYGTPGEASIDIPVASAGTLGVLRLNGDLGGNSTSPDVVGIQSNPVESGTPSTGDVYRWDGSQFVRWSPKYMTARLSSNQSTNIGDGDHVEFDEEVVDSGHITLSSGVGQANGVFTLPEGVWRLAAEIRANFDDISAEVTLRWAVNGGGTIGPSGVTVRPQGSTVTSNAGSINSTHFEVGPAGEDVELRILGPTDLTSFNGFFTHVIIEALA